MRPRHLLALILIGAAPVLSQSAPLAAIGGEDARGAELGNFMQVLVANDRIIVLERDAPFVRVFDMRGTQLQALGRAGNGPGEFRAPMSIAWDEPTRRLLILDPSNARLTTFQLGDSLAAPTFHILEKVSIRKLCTMNGKTFGLDRSGPQLVHELDISGPRIAIVRSFGVRRTQHALGAHPLVATRISDGPFICAPRLNAVVLASRMLGEINVVGVDDEQQRTLPVPAFRAIDLKIEDGGSTLSQSVPEQGMDLVDNLVDAADGFRVILGQWTRVPGSSPAPSGYRALRYVDGRLSSPETRRSMLVSWGKGIVVCSILDPVPTIMVYQGITCQ